MRCRERRALPETFVGPHLVQALKERFELLGELSCGVDLALVEVLVLLEVRYSVLGSKKVQKAAPVLTTRIAAAGTRRDGVHSEWPVRLKTRTVSTTALKTT